MIILIWLLEVGVVIIEGEWNCRIVVGSRLLYWLCWTFGVCCQRVISLHILDEDENDSIINKNKKKAKDANNLAVFLSWSCVLSLWFLFNDTMYAKLALTSPTSGGRSVGIVNWRTKVPEFVCLFVCSFTLNTIFQVSHDHRQMHFHAVLSWCTVFLATPVSGIYLKDCSFGARVFKIVIWDPKAGIVKSEYMFIAR
jgi:hypothetical protein